MWLTVRYPFDRGHPKSREFGITVPSRETTIGELRDAIAAKRGVPKDLFRVLIPGRNLVDNETLAHYMIQDGDIILLVVRNCADCGLTFRN